MADTNETTADIIAEMRGARTEFPFVYLMGEPDTPEVIDLRTKEITEPRKINMRRVTVKELADRIEAAHKREVDVLKQRCAELNAEIAAKDEVIKRLNDAISEEQRRKMATAENSSAVGDAAKLREALSDACYAMFNFLKAQNGGYEEMASALDKAKAALAEPVRNCDVGTAEEQYKRFMNMCNSKDVRQCAECSMRGFTPGCSRDRCFANWAQMPYEEKEGVTK